MLIVRSPFAADEVAQGQRLKQEIERAMAATRRELGTGGRFEMGMTGDIPVAIGDHASILNGTLLALVLTVLLVILGLLAFYRSLSAVGALLWALTVGVVATFGLTRLAIGHLNLATAFLSSIVVGNGINPGIVLLARHLEERRQGRRRVDALGAAMAGTWAGTLAASLTAAAAYGALCVTSFRGFRHFGIIGSVGMVLCWISAYTLLPAALAILERGKLRVRPRAPALGALLARLLPRRLGVMVALSLAVTGAAGVVAWRYLANPPYEDDFRKLHSSSPSLRSAQRWTDKFDTAFGKGFSGGFAVAVPERSDTQALVAEITSVDRGKDEAHRLFRVGHSIDEFLPKDQPEKLALLDELRTMLDGEVLDGLDEADRVDALRLRPPDGLRALADADLPDELAWPFTERDGVRGRIVLAMSGASYNTWIGPELFRFTDAFRKLRLPPGTVVGSTSFIMTDLLRSLERDGPRATLAALLGAVVVVLLLCGPGLHGFITLGCCVSGALLLVALASLIGIKVNFLDFVALPITIGIGIDYSVNVVMRERQLGPGSARQALATTGAAVCVCSFTTMVGYGSLLLSDNGGIRAFGLPAILGEATCLGAAQVIRGRGAGSSAGKPPPEALGAACTVERT